MSDEISSGVMMGITLIIVAMLIAIGFSLFSLVKGVQEEALVKVQVKLNEIETKEKEDITGVVFEETKDGTVANVIKGTNTSKPEEYNSIKETSKQWNFEMPQIHIGWQGISAISVVILVIVLGTIKAVKSMKITNNLVDYNNVKTLLRSQDEIVKTLMEFKLNYGIEIEDVNEIALLIHGDAGLDWYQQRHISSEEKYIRVIASNIDILTRNYSDILQSIEKGGLRAYKELSPSRYSGAGIFRDEKVKQTYIIPWSYLVIISLVPTLSIENFCKGDLDTTAIEICKKVRDEIGIYMELTVTKTLNEAIMSFNSDYGYNLSKEFYENIIYIANNVESTDQKKEVIQRDLEFTKRFKCNYLK